MNTVLFDLDGTLLSMNMDRFMELYFYHMGKYFEDIIDTKLLAKGLWASTEAMVKSLDERTNEQVFLEDFAGRIDGSIDLYKERFENFYDTEFLKVKEAVLDNSIIQSSVKLLKEKGYEMVIATNPLFPQKAIYHRIRWAGFEPEDFKYITFYEQNHYCKPQVKYYEEVLDAINKAPQDCLMVGNDVVEDMIAAKLGIKTFLIEDNILNEDKISCFNINHRGDYKAFQCFVKDLPSLV